MYEGIRSIPSRPTRQHTVSLHRLIVIVENRDEIRASTAQSLALLSSRYHLVAFCDLVERLALGMSTQAHWTALWHGH